MKRILQLFLILNVGTAFAISPVTLEVKPASILVNGKSSNVYRIEQPDGTWGYTGIKGKTFDVIVKNKTSVPTSVHWHGLVVPNDQDGVPYVSQPPIEPGSNYTYHFKLLHSGTYWMHSHFELQVQQLLSAPLIIKDPADPTENYQQVIMFLSDFSYQNPTTILYNLQNQKNNTMSHHMQHNSHGADLVDVNYDAFLTNYKTLQNPDIVKTKKGQKIRLRVIDASASTNFHVDLGKLKGKLIAVDGHAVLPINASKFSLAVGQRLDIILEIPSAGNFPILAQGEGTHLQTGLILTDNSLPIPRSSEKTFEMAGAIDYSQELKLHAKKPLSKKSVNRSLTLTLEGDMLKYVWKINNEVWPNITPLKVDSSKRIELVFKNQTTMSHPMHLHGHIFQVTEIDGKPITNGGLHDTILVLPNSTVKVQFDTDNPGNWMLHCHMLYHQESGMMTLLSYNGVEVPDFKKHGMASHLPEDQPKNTHSSHN